MKLFEDHLASSFYMFLNDNYQGSKQRPANVQMAGQILQPNFCTRSLHGLLQTWDYLGIMAPNSWYISFYHYLSFKQWNYLCIWREAKYKPITEVFNSKVCKAISLLLAVGDWVQDVIPKYGISNHGLFFAGYHVLVATTTVMSIWYIFFSFCEENR